VFAEVTLGGLDPREQQEPSCLGCCLRAGEEKGDVTEGEKLKLRLNPLQLLAEETCLKSALAFSSSAVFIRQLIFKEVDPKSLCVMQYLILHDKVR